MTFKIGAHLSKSNFREELTLTNSDIFQIFISNPRGYQPPTSSDKELFSNLETNVVIHLPYLVNFASENPDVIKKSYSLYKKTTSNLSQNIHSIVVHGGQGGKNSTVEEAIFRWVSAFKFSEKENIKLLVENTAGGNAAPGRELNNLIELVNQLRSLGLNIGVCYDTCHAFAAGVDDLIEGYQKLKSALGKVDLIHFNNSKDPLNSSRDRHELLKLGTINLENLIELAKIASLDQTPLILETPGDSLIWSEEIEFIRKSI